MAVTGSLPVAAQEAYAVFTSDGTFTFYYDNQRDTRQDHGRIYDMPKPGVRPAWTGDYENPQRSIKHVVFDDSFSEYRPTSTLSWFKCCINLQDIKGIRNLNTENVTNMRDMFRDCLALTSLNVSKFNTEKVTDMNGMFASCKALTSFDVSNFITQNVTNMGEMFSGCKALTSLDLTNFNTQNVTDMWGMFGQCQALTSLDLSNFNTQNVTNMKLMFDDCYALTSLDLSNFNTEKVTDMWRMFFNCKALTSLDLSNFNTKNVTNMNSMFGQCYALISLNVSNFNTEKVTDMWGMFRYCSSLTTIFCNSSWETSQNVKDEEIFQYCSQLKGTNTAYNANKTGIEMANPTTGYFTSLPVPAEAYAVLTSDQTLTFYYDSQRDTRQNYERIYDMPKPGERPAWAGDYENPQRNIKHVVFDDSFSEYRPTSTTFWFRCCISLQDIEGIRNLNTEKVTDMSGMFFYCQALTALDLSKFNTEKVTDMSSMFSGCEALKSLDLSNFNTQYVTNMSWMFADCSTLTSLDLSNFNTQNVTNMNWMFESCEALTSLDVSKFNTENVTQMGNMFSGCQALTSLDLSNFNTENVTYMYYMFYDCSALTSLDVSNFNIQNVTNMSYMFYGCTSLTNIYCNSNWEVGQNVKDEEMFYNCRQLKGTNTSFNENKIGIEMANPTTGYFTSKTTGIDHVKTADQAGDGKAYDLSGRRVNESYKGIVIKNGKKYIQK